MSGMFSLTDHDVFADLMHFGNLLDFSWRIPVYRNTTINVKVYTISKIP